MTRFGFVGVGRMGSALLKGFISRGLIEPSNVLAYDKDPDALEKAGVASKYSAFEVVQESDVVFLCVKPKDMEDVLDEIEDIAGSRLIVSIAAGVKTKAIEKRLKEARVIRVMPNTPAVIYELAAAYCLGKRAGEEDSVLVGSLLNSIGIAFKVEEKHMDAVTGLSGSGPAYVYYIIRALTEAGVKEGLDEKTSHNLVLQTIRGSVDMVITTKKSPEELIDEVKSPGGTTEEGLKKLEALKVGKSLVDAVHAATLKSKKLGK
ncbi:MAG: pyrroline-5-carboxylate reductase [Candidatus Altiarchaeales archaeon]|nr:pyrroline-5-carboxylate reductase [Candidatus Altiarchaeales archaeon]MBD3415970.1 pyrroline-5-carboxylate reductase [Candidatus Altiarchaeales archaeon]